MVKIEWLRVEEQREVTFTNDEEQVRARCTECVV